MKGDFWLIKEQHIWLIFHKEEGEQEKEYLLLTCTQSFQWYYCVVLLEDDAVHVIDHYGLVGRTEQHIDHLEELLDSGLFCHCRMKVLEHSKSVVGEAIYRRRTLIDHRI